ncbi:arsenate reductase (glutaredoxin) [Iodobacter fluviatilis]|uniref:Arsenate reductase n=1 Tax=Iodobacter fluviatilis TaxID=537 RepID=A0A377Q991_9NEIS|nr:arsenate reductase (glutaredoxin) [Iodobacter fluviatilis]TCU88639.1 arsenate reductase [Iodobacter fluviatilis]STQ91290.1 arsenate reductase [Iodobacter fluviatilis]
MRLLHNPRCSKSREALAELTARGLSPEIIDYLTHPLDETAIRTLIAQLGIAPLALVRTKEALWQAQFAHAALDDDAIITALAAHPKLIERPILIHHDRAAIGRPIENIFTLLDTPA